MKNFIFLFSTSLLFLISCSVEKPATTLKVDVSILDGEDLSVFNIVGDVSFVLNEKNDSITINIEDELILDLNKGWQHSYIHIKPGEQLVVDTISSSPLVFGVVGLMSKENKYLKSFQEVKEKLSEDFDISEVTKLPVDSFLMEIENKNQPLNGLLSEIENDASVSDKFKKALQSRMIGVKTNDLSYYKGFYNRHYEEDPILPDNFYSDFESGKINDPAYLSFDEGRQVLSFYHSKDLNYQEFGSLTDFYKASIASVKDAYGSSLVSDFASHYQLSNMINFGGGLDGTEEMIADFNSTVTNNYLIDKLEKTVEPWKPLTAGKKAPDFKASTRDGKAVKLSELTGKRVYVDVWATWCGPCIAEIPALKELEKDLHGEVEFVSVSIDDEKDKEKWEKFIDDRSLTGLQWMADGAWQSDVATAYNIKGIPRFMLIDEEGKIVSANAPRPSSENIKEAILN